MSDAPHPCAHCGKRQISTSRAFCRRCTESYGTHKLVEELELRDFLREKVAGEKPANWDAVDLEQMRIDRDRLGPIPVPAASGQVASIPRTINRWVKVGRHFALRQFPVAQPVARGRWHEPLR